LEYLSTKFLGQVHAQFDFFKKTSGAQLTQNPNWDYVKISYHVQIKLISYGNKNI